MAVPTLPSASNIHTAIEDFRSARQKATFEQFVSNLTGKSADLLSYNEVRTKLRAMESASRRLEMIPLNAIIGSVNRYTDFSRSFLPRQPSDQARWARVRVGIETLQGLPPIEVYQIGDAYFVLDGHHRVSVARELGFDSIQAYVTMVHSRVPLAPGDSPDDIILKSEYTDFLEQTNLDELLPGSNLWVTAPGQFQKLTEHIAVHRYFMGLEQKREISQEEAVLDWYDKVYSPVVNLIRARNLLRDFPGRTETDLYLWVMEYRIESGGGFGWELPVLDAVNTISQQYSPSIRHSLPRLIQQVNKVLIPAPLNSGPPPGQLRRNYLEKQTAVPHRTDHLFDDILVSVPSMPPSEKPGWPAIDFSIQLAQREEARLTGLHVITPDQSNESKIDLNQVEEEFNRRCADHGVQGRLIIANAQLAADALCDHSHLVDLLIFRSRFPPPLKPIVRLRSGARQIIRQAACPVISIPTGNPPTSGFFQRILLAYGGGKNADEALFIAAYLSCRWGVSLTVVCVQRPGHTATDELIERARVYLEEKQIDAKYIQEKGDPARIILLTAETVNADVILMGGYEASPLQETLKPSTVDRVLASTRLPVFICR